MNFRHFIITRFNLKLPAGASGSVHKKKPEWLEERVGLFLNYTYPSVVNQSEKDFDWLLYFDTDTPGSILQKLHLLASSNKRLHIIRVDSSEAFLNAYPADVMRLCPAGTTHVITTRLDNDDIVHCDFSQMIKDRFEGQSFMVVNFLKILILTPHINNKLFIDYSYSNHFMSLIEEIRENNITGCYARSDRSWDVKGRIIQISDRPYCAELITGTNIINDFRGFPVFRKTDMSEFGLKGKIFSNRLTDPGNFRIHRMSWLKLFRSIFLKPVNDFRHPY